MKSEEKNKPHISIPQKTAVAIVPPKKVRHFGYCLMPNGRAMGRYGLWVAFVRARRQITD